MSRKRKLNKRYTTVWVRQGKKAVAKRVVNSLDVNGVPTFAIDQNYAFNVNEPTTDKGKEQSVTVIRVTIPNGTPVQKGYADIKKVLSDFGYDPIEVLLAMGFTEVVYDSEFCERIIGKEQCNDCGGDLGCYAEA